MYKSYSSSEAVTKDTRIIIKEFTPASLTVNATFSGFQTSYSYYAGIDGVQKNVSTANGMKNSEIKEGTVTVTTKFNGVSSKLVNFKSVELLINGTKVGEALTAAESYTFSVPETTEWGEKKLSVKVTYTVSDGAEIYAESVAITRHITGLPVSYAKRADYVNWSVEANNNSSGTYSLYNSSQMSSPVYVFPERTNIEIKTDIEPSAGTKGNFTCGTSTKSFSSSTSSLSFDFNANGNFSFAISVKNEGTLSNLRYTKLNKTEISYR